MKPDNKPKEIKAPKAQESPPQSRFQPQDLSPFIPVLMALRTPRIHLTAAPDFIPKTFEESIQYYDDSTDQRLYLYINGDWRYVTLT